MKKKILYIGDFSDFYSTENYIAHGFEQLGYEVLRAPEGQVKSKEIILGAVLQYKVEFVMFSKGRFAGSEDAIAFLRSHNVLTVGWVFDLFFDVPAEFGRRILNNPSFKADICCMTDGGHLDKWKENRINHRLLRQGIHEPDAYFGKPEKDHPEVVFIGTYSYDWRIKMVGMLNYWYGENFRHYGIGGQARPIRGQKLNNVLASCKIVVGDSVPSDMYWSNRIYEVLGRGGFLLHPYVKGLETEFIDGVHYVSYEYGDYQGLRKKIDYYLKNDAEREKIRKAGFEFVKNNYTYTKRCEKMLEYIKQYKDERKK